MKRMILVLVAILCLARAGTALAEKESNRLYMAFGLFSVELPEGVTAGKNSGGALSDFRYETDGAIQLIYANCAPMDEYGSTAQKKLNSLLSLVYAISGSDIKKYNETDVAEETLENGIRLQWQIMRGDLIHALWFEAFDDRFGYNMCIQCRAGAADDEAMLTVMRSFRADTEREIDLMEVRQTPLPGGRFISVEHGLQIQLHEDWQIVPYPEYLLPGTAFMLVLHEGEQLIQLFCCNPVEAGDARALLDWYLQIRGSTAAGEPYALTLDGLGGVEAWVAEETSGVSMVNVAFVYESYGYYGTLMWVPEDEAEARPFMMEALRTMTLPE